VAGAQLVVVCVPSADGLPVPPCGTYNGQALQPTVIEQPALTAATVARIEDAAQPFDYAEAAGFWALPIAGVLGLYLAGLAVGSIIKTVGDA
jgi:hypothetical protein